ncbi:putative cellulose synthase (UDP-forming) [Helianthus annuus]|nr:putative cellulose synthase (UDP-forming) [Helianthus annuus]KAJ0770606.1 putative cellulose synthase (UDP-forming) [Helianthus annuus]
MCYFMDEENGNKIAYVQFPKSSYNITTHDLYASCFRVTNELEMGGMDAMDSETRALDHLVLQTGVCIVVVWINLPVYEGLFVRKDDGKMPTSVTCNSVILALIVCVSIVLFNN